MRLETTTPVAPVASSEVAGTDETPLPGTISFLGAPMHPWTMEKTLACIEERILRGRFTQHVVVNVAKLVHMREDETLRSAVNGCHIINIDGTGVVWGARAVGHDVPERVAGIDLFKELLDLAVRKDFGVYFLGADEEVIEETVRVIKTQHPELTVSGWHHGFYWREEEGEQRVVDEIRASGASMLFVGMSSPRKEKFIADHQAALGVPFVMGVGGSFDVVAGKVRRAPIWMQRTGLEWFYRFIQEPRRMWRRYLFTNSSFVLAVARARIGSADIAKARRRGSGDR